MRRIGMLALVLVGCAATTNFDRYDSKPKETNVEPPGDDDDDDDAGPDSPAFVQAGTGHAMTGPIAATIRPTTAGNLLVVMIANEHHDLGPVKSITDDMNNVYESANAKAFDTECNDGSEIWFAKNIKAGASKVTVTMTSNEEAEVWVVEASGLSKTAPLDKVAVANDGAKTGALAAPTVSPTSPTAFIVSTACACEEVTGIQQGNGFKNLDIVEGEGAAWFVSEDPGTFGAVWNATPGTFNASTASFKP